jgi:hypothetical protein
MAERFYGSRRSCGKDALRLNSPLAAQGIRQQKSLVSKPSLKKGLSQRNANSDDSGPIYRAETGSR